MRCPLSLRNAARLFWDFNTPRLPLAPRSSSIPQAWATHKTRPSDWCVFRLCTRNTQPAPGSVATVCSTWATKSASVRVGPNVGDTIRPHQTSRPPDLPPDLQTTRPPEHQTSSRPPDLQTSTTPPPAPGRADPVHDGGGQDHADGGRAGLRPTRRSRQVQ